MLLTSAVSSVQLIKSTNIPAGLLLRHQGKNTGQQTENRRRWRGCESHFCQNAPRGVGATHGSLDEHGVTPWKQQRLVSEQLCDHWSYMLERRSTVRKCNNQRSCAALIIAHTKFMFRSETTVFLCRGIWSSEDNQALGRPQIFNQC